ncbi:hypothetical protein [Brackiella oedipodis]|uniref:hypothetical protein n=1 Tax=Brackiella oedipodis TaxID=124225 RepID=UPI00056E8E12|nr:hypothetical protein [Brackiella oedipodis]
MKLISLSSLILSTVMLAACGSTEVEHSRAAECSRINSKIVTAPSSTPGMGGGNFISRNQANQQADDERSRARRLGCGTY